MTANGIIKGLGMSPSSARADDLSTVIYAGVRDYVRCLATPTGQPLSVLKTNIRIMGQYGVTQISACCSTRGRSPED